MGRVQKGKSRKRLRSWHHGRAAGRVFARRLVTVDPDVDYTASAPAPFNRKHPPKTTETV